MKSKKTISRKFLYRLFLFVAVITAASLFDHYNNRGLFRITESQKSSESTSFDLGELFYFNPVKISDLNPDSNDSGRKLFFKEQARFLQQHHNSRILYSKTLENSPPGKSEFLAMNRALIKQIHCTDPDEIPIF